MANQVVEAITKKLDQVLLTAGLAPNAAHTHTEPCSFCSSPMHHINNCPITGNYTDIANEQQVQAITTLRSGRIVDNHVEEKKDEHTEVAQNLQNDNSKQASNEVSSSAASTPEIPYEPRAPFPEHAISQVPAYAKFLKDLCTQKRKTRNTIPKKVLLTEQVSSLIKHNTPPKFKDPGAPTISCIIEKSEIDRALLDLGVGVNLLPYSVYQQLGLGELKPTTVILQLADRIEGYVEDSLPSLLTKVPVEACLNYFDFEEFNTDQYIQEVYDLLETAASADFHPWKVVKEPLPATASTPPVPSLLSPPKLELKPLPAKLKYAFLGSNNTLPI
ncbi:uncharacterized protein LOC132169812 [Corylus avellana]|uniref:uncharacterized protein LOC132169812 n=1 Tax=Corylus avellana TaxID=13451 RepID=UPI00286C9566|nr:uncharacterized protein LOC132169812 [Corylus avellana]